MTMFFTEIVNKIFPKKPNAGIVEQVFSNENPKLTAQMQKTEALGWINRNLNETNISTLLTTFEGELNQLPDAIKPSFSILYTTIINTIYHQKKTNVSIYCDIITHYTNLAKWINNYTQSTNSSAKNPELIIPYHDCPRYQELEPKLDKQTVDNNIFIYALIGALVGVILGFIIVGCIMQPYLTPIVAPLAKFGFSLFTQHCILAFGIELTIAGIYGALGAAYAFLEDKWYMSTIKSAIDKVETACKPYVPSLEQSDTPDPNDSVERHKLQ